MLPVKGQTYTVMLQIRTFLWSATYGEKGKDKKGKEQRKKEKRERIISSLVFHFDSLEKIDHWEGRGKEGEGKGRGGQNRMNNEWRREKETHGKEIMNYCLKKIK